MKKHPKWKGETAEAIVIAELLKREIPVSIPFGENQRYDLIMDLSGKLYKVQVKSVRWLDGKVEVRKKSKGRRKGKAYSKDYVGEIDFFLLYCYELDKVYMLEVNTKIDCLRVNPPKNNQKKGIHWAKDYELDAVLPRYRALSETS